MTNAQRRKFWFEGENGKHLVIVETNTGKTCILQYGFEEVFGFESGTAFINLPFEKAFETFTNELPWGDYYRAKNPKRSQLDQLIKYYNK